jgi:hypothetical protein
MREGKGREEKRIEKGYSEGTVLSQEGERREGRRTTK